MELFEFPAFPKFSPLFEILTNKIKEIKDNKEILRYNREKMKKKDFKNKCCGGGCGSGAVYGLGFVGAAIYYISNAAGFWMGVLGLLKAMVWPAFLVYELLKFLGM